MKDTRKLRTLVACGLALLAALLLVQGVSAAFGPDGSPQKYRAKDSAGGGDPFAPAITWNWNGILGSGTNPFPAVRPTPGTTSNCVATNFATNPFTYYGVQYPGVAVNLNGFLLPCNSTTPPGMNPTPPGPVGAQTMNNVPVSTGPSPNGIIAPYWTALIHNFCPNTARILTKEVPASGAGAGDATLIIEWNMQIVTDASGTSVCDTTSNTPPPNKRIITYQVHLKETSNNIEVYLADVKLPDVNDCPDGTTPATSATNCKATIGIENVPGTAGLSYAHGSAQTGPPIYFQHAVRFYPNHAPDTPLKTLVVNEGDTAATGVTLAPLGSRDVDGDPYEVSGVSGGLPGSSTTWSPTGVTYTPPPGDVCGTDSLTYTLKDQLDLTSTGTVQVTIVCINDAPSYTPGGDVTVSEDSGPYSQVWATNLMPGPATATDESTQTFTFTLTPTGTAVFSVPPAIDGTGRLTFTPAPDLCTDWPGGGTVTVDVVAKDSGGTANGGQDQAPDAAFDIEVLCVNDPPSFTAGSKLDIPAGSGSVVKAWGSNVVAGPATAADEAGQAVSFSVSNLVGTKLVTSTPVLFSDGTVKLDIDPYMCGEASYDVVASDNGVPAASSAVKKLLIGISCGLEARDDQRTIARGLAAVDLGVRNNDVPVSTDVEVVEVTQPAPGYGSVQIAADLSNLFYTPPSASYTGTATFTYTLELDGKRDSATVVVTVSDQDLVAQDDSYSMKEDSPYSASAALGVLANDLAKPGNPQVILVSAPEHGTVDLEVDGSFLYIPDPDFNGDDRFLYGFGSGGRVSNTAVARLAVASVNDPPQAHSDGYLARPDRPLIVAVGSGVLQNDFDPDGDALKAQVIQGPNHGSLGVEADGSFNYRAVEGYTGPDSFLYRAFDGIGSSMAVQVLITVGGNVPPVADFVPSTARIPAGMEVTMVDRSYDPDGSIVSWSWEFGDGKASLDQNPVHRFAEPGEYTVRLRVTDGDGASAGAERVMQVLVEFTSSEGGEYTGAPPVADAGADQAVLGGRVVLLDGSGGDAAKALAFHWKQIEGPPVTLVDGNTAHPKFNIPASDGTYLLVFSLVIFDGHHSSEADEVVIRVLGPGAPVQQAFAGADLRVEPGTRVHLTGAAAGFPEGAELTYTWRQVGGPYSAVEGSGVDVEFDAPSAGTVEVQLTVRGAGLQANDTVAIRVQGEGPRGFETERGGDSERDLILFQPLVQGRQYIWDFGDGTPRSTETAPLHKYAKSGTYPVTLEVLQPDGRTTTYTHDVRVFVESAREDEEPDKGSPGLPAALGLLALAAVALARRRQA